MMKKITFFGLALGMALSANAGGSVDLRGESYNVDTLYHATVGPGITQTSLLIANTNRTIRAFYATIDLSDPNVTIKAVSATDKINGNEWPSNMAKRKDAPGARYLVGINGDFYHTSGSTMRGQSMVGTPVGACIADGVLYSGASGYWPFVLDTDEKVYINPVGVSGTVTLPGGNSVLLHGVNVGPYDGKITVYNSKYYSSTNASGGAEVQAVMADGAPFVLRGDNKLVVTSEATTDGDMLIPDGGYVIDGRGATLDMVKNLKVGDTVTVNMAISVGGVIVNPREVIGGQPKIVENNTTLDVHGDLMDAYHPRTAVGYFDGGKKVVFMVVDGRSAISAGCTTLQLGDIMRYTGCTEAVNFDGGGSSCLYIKEMGLRNIPSDGSERADANGLYVVSTAPDDSTIASIKFVDWHLKSPKYAVYTPVVYGYNRYGVLINTDVKGVKLSCPETIGHIKSDTTFFADGNGYALLTATYNGCTATLPVTVSGGSESLSMRLDSVLNDGYRHYAVEVTSTVGENTMTIDPSALTWSSSDQSVVSIDANTGVLCGVADGTATVTGTVEGYTGNLKVTVEKPTSHVMPIDPALDPSTWTTSISGGDKPVVEAVGDGLKCTFNGKSARLYYLNLNKKLTVWSMPDTLRVRLNPGDVAVTSLVFTVRIPGGKAVAMTVQTPNIKNNAENVIDLPTAQWADVADVATFPITLSTLRANFGKTTVGNPYTMTFNGIEAVYNMKDMWPTSVETLDAATKLTVRAAGRTLVFSSAVDAVSVYDLNGREILSDANVQQVQVPCAGAYVVTAKLAGRVATAKLVLH